MRCTPHPTDHTVPIPVNQQPTVQWSDSPIADEAMVLRREIIEALYHAGGGHYGGSLSVIDLLLTLYRRHLRVVPSAPRAPARDRLILSKGHAAIAHYAVLRRLGFFTTPLTEYARFASPLEGHPDMTALGATDFSTGSLGQGVSVGLGMAMALRGAGARVFVVVGDGECQEGQVWEAAMLAAQQRLANLHVIVDHNRYQEWGWGRREPGGEIPLPVEQMPDKWRAFGWRVFEVDGHDFEALDQVIRAATGAGDRPSVVVAHTIKGRGVPLIESDPVRFHCCKVSAAEHEEFRRALSCA